MDTVFLTEQANQKVVGDPSKVLNKRIDYLVNAAQQKRLYLKDNFGRPTQEIVYYFPSAAIQTMLQRDIVKKWVYLILYTQDPESKLDRYEDPTIYNDHDFDCVKGLTKQEKAFHKAYKNLKIYQLYCFDSDNDAREFFKMFLVGVNCSDDTIFFFAKRRIDKFDNYQAYMRDRDEDELESDSDPEQQPVASEEDDDDAPQAYESD